MTIRTYTDLVQIQTHKARYEYLTLRGVVGEPTFGTDRYLNQKFYQSREWRNLRYHVIARDEGRDLGIEGYEIYDQIYIHHMNPVSVCDIVGQNLDILNPEYLISVTMNTHNAIHFGDASLLREPYVERKPGDTKLW